GWSPLPLTIKEGRKFAAASPLPRASDTLVGARHASPLPHPNTIVQNDATWPTITLQNTWFGYGHKEIFHGLNLQISSGEITAIMGRNGTGKTTLLRLIMGLLKP